MLNFPTSDSLFFYDDLDPNILFPPVEENERDSYIVPSSQEVFQQISSFKEEPTLQRRVTELSPLTQPSSVLPSHEMVDSSLKAEISSKKRREASKNEETAATIVSVQKKQRINREDQPAKSSQEEARLEKDQVRAKAFREQQKKLISDLAGKINVLKKQLMDICRQNHINYPLLLPPSVTEKQIEALVSKEKPQWTEFAINSLQRQKEFLEKVISEISQKKFFISTIN